LSSEPIVEYIEKESEVEDLLAQIDVNNLTPMDALNKLNELKRKL
jgi:DNA mismatch repair ATPase MutS